MNAIDFRRNIESKGRLSACRMIDPSIESEEQSDIYCQAYVQRLLSVRKYAPAGIVLWGETLFNPRPVAVRAVWDGVNNHSKCLIQGGGAVGKSYTGIAWTFLDWIADPEYTTVKLISTTGGHAKSNTFSTMKSLHREAVCTLPGIVRAESIALTESDQRSCVAIVRIKEGEDNSGVLQGFHPLPRPKEHPMFGKSSRVRALLDEAEEIPNGVWTGIDNMLTSADGSDTVKIMGFYNPKDITSKTAHLTEPMGGWSEFDIETGVRGKDSWTSREGWHVVRLDPKKTENIKARKTVFTGFQTYEGFRTLEQKDGGNSLSYYTFGRGAYPPDSALCVIVPQRVMATMRGEFIFVSATEKLGGADIAIDGRDEAVFSVGRYGKASAFKRMKLKEDGTESVQIIKFPEDRWCLQLDQQFNLPKGSAKIVGDAIKSNCLKLGIKPENMMIDATGNGSPVLNYLRLNEVWSESVQGIDFGKSATGMRILEEDKKTCEEQYEGIHTEVWFALSRWGEFGYFAISPGVRAENLERELMGRRYLLGAGEKLKVEKKEVYKKRLGRSPDNADSATILVHCARLNRSTLATMTGVVRTYEDVGGHGHVDRVEWVEFK